MDSVPRERMCRSRVRKQVAPHPRVAASARSDRRIPNSLHCTQNALGATDLLQTSGRLMSPLAVLRPHVSSYDRTDRHLHPVRSRSLGDTQERVHTRTRPPSAAKT